jgi:hypothetical protein
MIRPRRSEDLQPCLVVLRAMHRADRYPVRWPQDPARWLAGRAGLAAWVSETDGAPDGLRLVLDVADHNLDAIAFYERRGWTRVGTASLLLDDGHTMLPLVLFVLPESA